MKIRKTQRRRIISFIICCSVVMGLFTPVGKMDKVYANAVQLEQALQWAVAIANDNSHDIDKPADGDRITIVHHW